MGFIALGSMIPACLSMKARLPRRTFGGRLAEIVDLKGLRDMRYTLCVVGAMLMGLGRKLTSLIRAAFMTDNNSQCITRTFTPRHLLSRKAIQRTSRSISWRS